MGNNLQNQIPSSILNKISIIFILLSFLLIVYPLVELIYLAFVSKLGMNNGILFWYYNGIELNVKYEYFFFSIFTSILFSLGFGFRFRLLTKTKGDTSKFSAEINTPSTGFQIYRSLTITFISFIGVNLIIPIIISILFFQIDSVQLILLDFSLFFLLFLIIHATSILLITLLLH